MARRGTLAAWGSFVRGHAHRLRGNPALLLQEAVNGGAGTAAGEAADRRVAAGRETRPWCRRLGAAGRGSDGAITALTIEARARRRGRTGFSPDGRRILSVSWETPREGGTLAVWDAATGRELPGLWTPADRTTNAAVLPDGRVVAIFRDGWLRIWDANTAVEVHAVRSRHDGFFACDGRLALSGSGPLDDTIRLWDAGTGADLHALAGHDGRVFAAAFSADGRRAVSGDERGRLRVWDLERGAEVATLAGHRDAIATCAFSLDGRSVVSSSFDRTQRVWDAASGRPIAGLPGGPSEFVFAPGGRHVLSVADDERAVRVWQVDTGREVRRLAGHSARVNSIAVSPDGRRAATGSDDRRVRLWDLDTGALVTVFDGHAGAVTQCAFSPDGARLVSASTEDLRTWDAGAAPAGIAAAPAPAARAGHAGPVRAWAFAADGARLVTASADRTLKVWDVRSGEPALALEGHGGPVTACAWSPDGRLILSASEDRTLRLWDAASGRTTRVLSGHEGPVRRCAFSPDGARVASASDDRTIRIWQAGSGAAAGLLDYRPWVDTPGDSAFSADGARLLEMSRARGRGRVWDLATGDLLATLDRRACTAGALDASRIERAARDAYAGYADDVGRLWELGFTREEEVSLPSSSGPLRLPLAVSYSKDRRRFVLAAAGAYFKCGSPPVAGDVAALAGRPVMGIDGPVAATLFAAGFRRCPAFDWAYSADDRHVASTGPDRRLRVWTAEGAAPVAEYWLPSGGERLVWSPREPVIAAACDDGGVHVIRVENLRVDPASGAGGAPRAIG